ncbi:ShlB/FhaC/HecB family hemolysin secretion/activation protein [Helicobacter cappadocius]|uniref:ShlB/FhaC/HecB family hemolysin secretion/activation protein n=1 Tax=Helicobacter cappadocius TaxID=3063998 RepID=A0AA90PLB4_9HELI|nr:MULTISPECIES: ShlB/FhaC/HecB family hemolysin secretion/activation protein [unclassified Helicobacter]MDO7253326.1 ShlB/FhaC/HecB family hemolysin secretion/activation protein [Helicobacter sp. faydin-H75]MDP2539244.1 ShlB/FhaC/HecB family hemolysin secretion/activation protein [Helicobacter sp. faydin-H76]
MKKLLLIILVFLSSLCGQDFIHRAENFSSLYSIFSDTFFRHHKKNLILLSKGIPFDLDFSSIISDTSNTKKPPCFLIKNIDFIPLDMEDKEPQKILKKFSFTRKITKPYLNTCIGAEEINTFLNKLNVKAIQKGYITTKFGLLPQDLNSGTLKIGIEVGFVGDIQYINEGQMFFFSKDFGVKKGDVLDLQVIELGITNLKRLRYLSPTSKIIPMSKNSESKIFIATNVKSLPIFIQASFDNGGSLKEGYEGTFLLGIENPLHLADSLQVYLLGSMPISKIDHSYYASLSYSIPIRRFLFQFDSSYAHNANQLIFYGISPVYSGKSINGDFKATYLAHVNAKNQLSFGIGVSSRFSDNYLENIKLDVQTKKLAEISAFVSYKRYVGNSQFNLILSLIQGVPIFTSNQNYNKSSYVYTIPSVNLYIYHPFSLWKSLFVYNSTIKTQISRDQLYASEKMTIGGRYSVRGFNHFSLSGQMGVLYRNDLMMYLPNFWRITLAPSLGIDMGYVRDIVGDNQSSGFLSGGGVGIQLLSKYFNAQLWGYLPFYNPYKAPTQSLFFFAGVNW